MPEVEMPLNLNNSSDNSSISSIENIASSRTSSSDGQNVVIFEQDQISVMSHFIPTFPPRLSSYEPKLDELLIHASGSANLDTLRHIQLRVTSNMFGLHRLNVFLPALVALNLDGSSLNTLRDLGDSLTVKYLNVSRCGLKNFDGINGLSTIEHLVADDNSIREIAQLANLVNLSKLSLRGNRIEKFGTVSFLACCSKLQSLDLINNPISLTTDYENKIKDVIPQLFILDGHAVSEQLISNDDSDKFTLSELSSSLSSASKGSSSHGSVEYSNAKASDLSVMHLQRPASSYHHRIDGTNIQCANVRPSTAGPLQKSNFLTTGDIIVGNIVAKARIERRHRQHSSNSSSSINSASSTTSHTSHDSASKAKFSNIISQNKVRMELRALAIPIGLAVKDSPSNSPIMDDHVDLKLLTAIEKWKKLCEKLRLKKL